MLPSTFLQLSHGSSARRNANSGSLDPRFLTSYFSHPGATVADEALFTTPTQVMGNFIQARYSSSSKNNNREFIKLLRGIAVTLENHARPIGKLTEAAKSLYVVLAMSPATDFEGYVPRAADSERAVLSSALPWDRLAPLLQEVDNNSQNNTKSGSAPSTSSSSSSSTCASPSTLFSLTGGGLDLLCACDDGSAQYQTTSASRLLSALAGRDFFSLEPCKWMANQLPNNNSNVDDSTPENGRPSSNNNALQQQQLCWSSTPAAWATDALVLTPARDAAMLGVNASSNMRSQQHADDQDEHHQQQNLREETLLERAARRIDFLRFEMPTQIDGGSAAWPGIWRALHRALIGHGDTLGIVGPDPDQSPLQQNTQPCVVLRVTVWPAPLSFVPSMFAGFCRCGTLLLRLRVLVQIAMQSQDAAAAHEEQHREEQQHDNGGRLGRIGLAVFFALQRFIRGFEAEALHMAELAHGSTKITHAMLLQRAALLQREMIPRVLLLASVFHVSTDRHWTARESLGRLGGGLRMLDSLYDWLVANEHATAPLEDDDGCDTQDEKDHATTAAAATTAPATQNVNTASLHMVVRDIFLEGFHQFHAMVSEWVQFGRLRDPFGEFFLVAPHTNTGGVVRVRGSRDNSNSSNNNSSVPRFFTLDPQLVRDAGLAQLLLESERRAGCVSVVWERVDEVNEIWPASETLFWSVSPPSPTAVLAMWRDFVDELLPQSILILALSPRALRAQQEQEAARQRRIEQRRAREETEARLRAPARRRQHEQQQLPPPSTAAAADNGSKKNKELTNSEIWNRYMDEARRDAAAHLIQEHEERMAQSERRAEIARWRQRRIGLSAERRQALALEKEMIVQTLQQFASSGRDRIAIPILPRVSVPIVFPPPQHQQQQQQANDDEDEVVRIESEEELQQQQPEKQSDQAAVDNAQQQLQLIDTAETATTVSVVAPSRSGTTTTTTTNTRRRQQVQFELTRIGQLAPQLNNGNNDDDDGEQGQQQQQDKQPGRNLQPDFTWDPLHDAVGSNPQFQTPEEVTAQLIEQAQRLLPDHIVQGADAHWFGPVNDWAHDCLKSSPSRERTTTAETKVAVIPIATLIGRYRTVFGPMCQRLIRRAVLVSLQDPAGSLRSVTDALIASCMLQNQAAVVGLQDRIVDSVFFGQQQLQQYQQESSNSNIATAASTSASSRMRACFLIWRSFWSHDLAGDHSRFLDVSLEVSSAAAAATASTTTISPLILLQQARLIGRPTSDLYRHFFEALLPPRCIERHSRIFFSLLTWTVVDRMCVSLWRNAGTRPRQVRQQQPQQQQAQEEHAPPPTAAALWQFVTVARGVLTALRQHMWHNVCSAVASFNAKLNEQLSSGGSLGLDDDEEELASFGFASFARLFDELLDKVSVACWLADHQVEMRRTISVMMRLVEQVHNVIINSGGASNNSNNQVPASALLQVTEQFVVAARTLEVQVMTTTSQPRQQTTLWEEQSSMFSVVSAIRAALPRNV